MKKKGYRDKIKYQDDGMAGKEEYFKGHQLKGGGRGRAKNDQLTGLRPPNLETGVKGKGSKQMDC